jgi:xylulokinase
MRRQDWSQEILAHLGLQPGQLPPAFPPAAPLGQVSRAAARASGLPAGLPVFAGLGDGQAGGVGANICRPGTAYLTLGTSVISGAFSDRYLVDNAFRTMTGGAPGAYLLETVLLGGTYTLDWLLRTVLRKEGAALARQRQEFEARLEEVPPGSQGLVLLPYWNSAMNPYWDAAASGLLIGLRGSHTALHLYRAILEGIAFELRLQLEFVEKALRRPIETLVLMGGGARSPQWCQIVADVTGKPASGLETEEAAALGAGILAAAGSGLYSSVTEAAQVMSRPGPRSFEPGPESYRRYSDLFEGVYRGLYPALRQSMARLDELART